MLFTLFGDVQYEGNFALRQEAPAWEGGILFDTASPNFKIIFRVSDQGSFDVGVVHRRADREKLFTKGHSATYTLHMSSAGVVSRRSKTAIDDLPTPRAVHYKFAMSTSNIVEGLSGLKAGDVVSMVFEETPKRQLSFAVNHGQPVHVITEEFNSVADGEYLPFVRLGTINSVEVRAVALGKRKRSIEAVGNHGQRMWEERQFTDVS
eukprot:TRINITY_DN62413_c0_g1_i1.p1 TRINITY_DN62413_c0_g1~~TRINITY_DN62413_c0_g1_i1.p1  ORF type:complete len:215 (+),score=39.16 TRINITY_DN62413_c0_g1_i1:25-645(+)